METIVRDETVKDAAVRLVKATYIEGGWITPLSKALAGVTKEVAAWRPAPGVKSIWEVTAHLANYLESLVNGFENKPPVKFNDWPRVDPAGDWVSLRTRVIDLSNRLYAFVQASSEEELGQPGEGKKVARALKIVDIAVHDAYHSGQIEKLKQLHKSTTRASAKAKG